MQVNGENLTTIWFDKILKKEVFPAPLLPINPILSVFFIRSEILFKIELPP